MPFELLRIGAPGQAGRMLGNLLSRALTLDGTTYPNTLMIKLDQAQVLLSRGLPNQAVDAFSRLHDPFVNASGATHQLTLGLIEQKAIALEQLERYDEAARDEMELYHAAVAKAAPQSLMAAGALSDASDSECRAADALMAEPALDAEVDLAGADIALASGDMSHATALLQAPRRAFQQVDADPHYRRWTGRLVQELASVAPVPRDGEP